MDMITFNINTILAIGSLLGTIGAVFVFVNRMHWEIGALHKEKDLLNQRIASIEFNVQTIDKSGGTVTHALEKQLNAFESRIESRFMQLETRLERVQNTIGNVQFGRRKEDHM